MAMFLLTLLLEVVFLVGVIFHLGYFNGSPYWQWDWRRLDHLRTATYFAFPLIPYAYALFKIERFKEKGEVWKILVLLVVSNFLFQLMGIASDPYSFDYVKSVVLSRRATSYFYDAHSIEDIFSFLRSFHTLELRAHSSVHPPGPILFFFLMIQVFGVEAGAYVGGLAVGLIASFGIFALYLFASLWTRGPEPRLIMCAVYALIPGVVLFLPQLDQVYPIFSMLMIYFWEIALRGSRRHALYLGFTLLIASFFAYHVLLIGVFHILSAGLFLSSDRVVGERLRILVRTSLLAIGTAVTCYLALFLLTGYNPVLAFAHAWEEAAHLLNILGRPYVFYLFYNFYEFFLGSGIILVPLLLSYVKRTIGTLGTAENWVTLSYAGFATLLVVDLIGVLRSETTRLWLFLQPLILVPIGLELIRMDRLHRWMIFVMLWVNLVVLKSNMWFIIP
jgi:hypothetical protein